MDFEFPRVAKELHIALGVDVVYLAGVAGAGIHAVRARGHAPNELLRGIRELIEFRRKDQFVLGGRGHARESALGELGLSVLRPGVRLADDGLHLGGWSLVGLSRLGFLGLGGRRWRCCRLFGILGGGLFGDGDGRLRGHILERGE